MSRTIRTPPPARRGRRWDPEFLSRLVRGQVDLEKRDHTDMPGDVVWKPRTKARAKVLRNRRLRRVARLRISGLGKVRT